MSSADLVLVLAVLLAPAPSAPPAISARAQGKEAKELDMDELYPPKRNAALLHFASIEGKVEPEPLRKAIVELGTSTVEARIVYGPESTASRPGRWFLAVEAPATVSTKDLIKALKRGANTVEELAFTCFKGRVRDLPDNGTGGLAGVGARDWVLGMSNDLRWADTFAGWYQFYSTPGKMDAATIADRFAKLFGPIGGGSVGTLVREGVTWNVTSPVDDAVAKRVEKAIVKLPGVVLAKLDAKEKTLRVEFVLDDLRVSGPAVPVELLASLPAAGDGAKADAGAPKPPRARFDVNPLLDALDKERVTVAQRDRAAVELPSAGGAGGPPKPGG